MSDKYNECMIRKNFYLTKEQSDTLASMKELTISEHIRRAVDDYIKKTKKEDVDYSPSKIYDKSPTC